MTSIHKAFTDWYPNFKPEKNNGLAAGLGACSNIAGLCFKSRIHKSYKAAGSINLLAQANNLSQIAAATTLSLKVINYYCAKYAKYGLNPSCSQRDRKIIFGKASAFYVAQAAITAYSIYSGVSFFCNSASLISSQISALFIYKSSSRLHSEALANISFLAATTLCNYSNISDFSQTSEVLERLYKLAHPKKQ